MEDPWGDRAIAVKFDRIPESLETLRGLQADGVLAVGDGPAVLAAEAARICGARFHPPEAARSCHDKYAARELYRAAGLAVPQFFRASLAEEAKAVAARAPYPCVLKPIGLSASRGVIRANDEGEFEAAFGRIRAMLGRAEFVQVESYIPGREFAVEGVMNAGALEILALFDKPDPLDGPFFEETLYVTPSRETTAVQRDLVETTRKACAALGLSDGPVHAELRYNEAGAWILEVAARPIGGLCARAVRANGTSLEEVLLRNALGLGHGQAGRAVPPGSGVMMIPIPRGGIYESVSGVERARAVPGVEDIVITATVGQRLVPLPEGASYLGFIFARGESAEFVEAALRRSHQELRFQIATALETFAPEV